MKQHSETLFTLITFLVLIVAFYFLGYWLIYRMGQATPLMLSVGAATITTCLIRKRKFSSLGWQWRSGQEGSKYQYINYLIPLLIALVSYLVIWLFGFGDVYNADFLSTLKDNYNLSHWNNLAILLLHIGIIATISFVVSLPSILGEEIGWRGFLVPELAKIMPFAGVALVSGLIWSLFHWPLIFLGLYGNDVTPLPYQLLVFSVFITSTGTIMAYFRLKTQSVWPAVFYHGSSNIFIQKLFTPITVTTTNSAWYIDEFGAVLAITATLVALYYLKKGNAEFTR
ncbi:CPBP family intramembrane glutamic endopeptidase [Alteromonas sp. a30]|uniref:CPBP family intramembrane glutamic endopeptidase n=1 Tax=Alteromonas sp. a30 TaxID=2730917 RepID=UPI00227EF5F6|nr:CPBP family intramembrane glutamic endopeptidase [Alteromonas sp. a30]MCY7295195.1 CPBP family intramembrane metalloprotease [Alteromonas sp. a30]